MFRLSVAESMGGFVRRRMSIQSGSYSNGIDFRQYVGKLGNGALDYFARICLEVALTAHREGNYGIGAVAVHFKGGRVREYRGGNRVVADSGIIDHAETRALLRITRNETPDAEYSFDFGPSDGLWVFGTLEPCPMCASVMTNAGATRSISTIGDGRLHDEDSYRFSDGAADVIGKSSTLSPRFGGAFSAAAVLSSSSCRRLTCNCSRSADRSLRRLAPARTV